MKKKLPIGVQSFAELIQEGYLYVDKTETLHNLIHGGKYYFLSRPRRFGKSLLVSTLREIFEGNKALFKGLWIEDKIEWRPRPVILLDFTRIVKRAHSLEKGIELELMEIAESHGVTLHAETNAGRFQELIKALGQENKVAILVDEYDKPILDHIDDADLAEQNRQIIKSLYSIVKGNDSHISFLLLTGVSKFSQVSITSTSLSAGFSDLNNLNDITLDRNYSTMLGYTEAEIRANFPEYLAELAEMYRDIYPDIMAVLKEWYNGYTWDGEQYVCNPFSVLNLFFKNDFGEYWFATGTPTFLIKLIRKRNYSIFDMENRVISQRAFNKFDISNIEINSLLFQAGYLTIRSLDKMTRTVTLDFPNKEVENAFSFHLLAEFAEKSQERTDSIILRINDRLSAGRPEGFVEAMQAMFADIAYPIQPTGAMSVADREMYYHSIFYLVLKLLGYNIQAEVITSRGRIDAVITTEGYVYVLEFKIGDAASALAQIKSMGYHQKYMGSGKKVMLLGIGFDRESRNIGGYEVEEAGN